MISDGFVFSIFSAVFAVSENRCPPRPRKRNLQTKLKKGIWSVPGDSASGAGGVNYSCQNKWVFFVKNETVANQCSSPGGFFPSFIRVDPHLNERVIHVQKSRKMAFSGRKNAAFEGPIWSENRNPFEHTLRKNIHCGRKTGPPGNLDC